MISQRDFRGQSCSVSCVPPLEGTSQYFCNQEGVFEGDLYGVFGGCFWWRYFSSWNFHQRRNQRNKKTQDILFKWLFVNFMVERWGTDFVWTFDLWMLLCFCPGFFRGVLGRNAGVGGMASLTSLDVHKWKPHPWRCCSYVFGTAMYFCRRGFNFLWVSQLTVAGRFFRWLLRCKTVSFWAQVLVTFPRDWHLFLFKFLWSSLNFQSIPQDETRFVLACSLYIPAVLPLLDTSHVGSVGKASPMWIPEFERLRRDHHGWILFRHVSRAVWRTGIEAW